MSDLTLQSYYYCKSVENFQVQIGKYTVKHGTSRGQYQYDFNCTCPAFKFRKQCKHIEEAKQFYCGWDQFIDDKEVVNKCCPNCNGAVDSRLVGV